MSSWTYNISDAKKNIIAAIQRKRETYENQNYLDGQVDVVEPIVQAILDKFNPGEDETVDVNVSIGTVFGTAVNVNVVIH